MKICETVSIGTEILMGEIVDTNAREIGRMLPALGIAHQRRQTVGDNLERIIESIQSALSRSDIVITIGGLGPTQDDLTRDAIAGAIGAPLEKDDRIEEALRKLFAFRNLPWTEGQIRQAMVPQGGQPIDNPNGSAPGLICPVSDKVVIALPGPKGEFIPMLQGPVRTYLQGKFADGVIVSRTFRISRLGESVVEDRLMDLMASTNPALAPYASPGEVRLRLSARADNEAAANALLDPMAIEIRTRLGDAIFAEGEDDLETTVIKLMADRGLTLATAESITGGGLAERLTSVPGSSAVFRGAVVAYQIPIKIDLLGVDPEKAEDPVSEEVAIELARGAREKCRADYGIGLTGNAGPTSDEGGKPVGLVYIGIVGPKGEIAHRFQFRGTREDIRRRSTQSALTTLRDYLLNQESLT